MKTKSQMFLLSIATACGLGVAAIAQEASQDPGLSGSKAREQSSTSTSPSPSSSTTSSKNLGTSGSQHIQDGLVKHEGTIKFIKNGHVQKVDKEMKLSEGITVQPNGDVELKDGTKMTLQEGQMVTLDSQVTTIPPEAVKTLKESASEETPSSSSSSGTSRGSSESTTAPLE